MPGFGFRRTCKHIQGRAVIKTCSAIAQLVERLTVNQNVPGSSPGRGAKINADLAQLVERQFCKLDVAGSIPAAGTIFLLGNRLMVGHRILIPAV